MQIIDNLETQLLNELTVHHYEGLLNESGEGYLFGSYESMRGYLNGVFVVNEECDFWFVINDETYRIYDIKWSQVRRMIIQKLYEEQLFTKLDLTDTDIAEFSLKDFILYLKNASTHDFNANTNKSTARSIMTHDMKLLAQTIDALDWRNSEQRPALCCVLNEMFLRLIRSAYDCVTVLKLLSSSQKKALCERLVDTFPELIKTTKDLITVLKQLNGEQSAILCRSLANQIPEWIATTKELQYVLICSSLNKEHYAALCPFLMNHLSTQIHSMSDYDMMLSISNSSQKQVLFDRVADSFPELIKTKEDLVTVLKELDGEQSAILCRSLTKILPDIIPTTAELHKVLLHSGLNEEHRVALCQSLMNSFPLLRVSAHSVALILSELSAETRFVMIEALREHWQILLSVNNCGTLLHHFTPQQFSELIVNANDVHFFEHFEQLKNIISWLKPQQRRELFSRFNEGFNRAVRDGAFYTKYKYYISDEMGAEIYQAVHEHASLYTQLVFHIGRYWLDYVCGDARYPKPAYLSNNNTFFSTFQNVSDAGNKIAKPAAMIVMHCFSCLVQVIKLLSMISLTAIELIVSPFFVIRDRSFNCLSYLVRKNAAIIADSMKHLVIINALFVVALPLAIASIFTRSTVSVLTLFSNLWNSTEPLVLDNEPMLTP